MESMGEPVKKILFSTFCEILGKTMYVWGGNGEDIPSEDLINYFKTEVEKESYAE
jgi:hypothetical protein